MGYFAKVENGIVKNVVVANEALDETYIETFRDRSQRKNYAGIGMSYNSELDMFIAPSPFPSWALDEAGDWQAPEPKPEGNYSWDEETLTWINNEL